MAKAEDILANRKFLETVLECILKDPLPSIKSTFNKSIEEYNSVYKKPSDPNLTLKSLINDFKEGKGRNSLHFAASRGDLEIFRYLFENGGNLDLKDSEGNTVLFIATQHNNLELAIFLIDELKMSPFSKRNNGVSCLHIASSLGNVEMLNLFCSKKCDLEDMSDYGTALDWAVSYNQCNLVRELIKKGANLMGGSISKKELPPPLIIAINLQFNEIATVLIQTDYQLIFSCKDKDSWSILHVASEVGNVFIVDYIVKQIAEKENKEKLVAFCDYIVDNTTALDLAYQYEKWDCATILRDYTTRKNKEPKKQENLSQEGLINNRSKADELKLIGNKFFEEEKYVEALEKYKEAISYDSSYAALYTNSAGCYVKLKEFQKALEMSQKAKKIDPKWIKAYFREGEAYLHLKEYGDAAASFWEGLNLEPGNKVFKEAFDDAVKQGREQIKK